MTNSDPVVITGIATRDLRFNLGKGVGTDAVHTTSVWAYPVTVLTTNRPGLQGTGLGFTLGGGNDLVCKAAEELAKPLLNRNVEDLMAEFGKVSRSIAEHPQYRWLGPHKGAVGIALASITNACFDLWSKVRGVPLYELLLSLSVDELLACLDFSFLEDELTVEQARKMLVDEWPRRAERMPILQRGYPCYDTGFGWLHFSDEEIEEKAKAALNKGFKALKLKVGSADPDRDIRRARLVRKIVGPDVKLMFDVNEQWSVPQAHKMCKALAEVNPFWIEEPTQPDDVFGHQSLVKAGYPIAVGEVIPNRIIFKSFMQARALHYVQVDPVRTGGVSECIVVAMLAKKFGLKMVPHVGDVGQINQHLCFFYHIALGHDEFFLEHMDHLHKYFVHPADVRDGVYRAPTEPGASSDLKDGI